MRISDWSSDVCSSDLHAVVNGLRRKRETFHQRQSARNHRRQRPRHPRRVEIAQQTADHRRVQDHAIGRVTDRFLAKRAPTEPGEHPDAEPPRPPPKAEEASVGEEGVREGRTRGAAEHYKKKIKKKK